MTDLEDAISNALALDEYANPLGSDFDEPEEDPNAVPDKIEYKYGRYVNLPPLPGEDAPRKPMRASTIAKTLEDTYFLDLWKLRQVVRGCAVEPDLIDPIIQEIRDGEINFELKATKKRLDRIAARAMDLAGSNTGADAGTKFHDLAEEWDLTSKLPNGGNGTDWEMLSAYSKILATHKIKAIPDLMERVIICPDLDVAGRLDRMYDDNGKIRIGDLKSQKWEPGAFDHLSLSIQLAIYANAKYMLDMDTWTWRPMPPVALDMGVVIWVPFADPGHADVYNIDLEQGWKFAKAAVRIREWRKLKNVVKLRRVSRGPLR